MLHILMITEQFIFDRDNIKKIVILQKKITFVLIFLFAKNVYHELFTFRLCLSVAWH